MATRTNVVVFKCRKKNFRWEIAEIVRYLTDKQKNTKFRLSLKLSLLCRSHPNLPGPAPNIWLTMFQISSKSAHLQLSYSRTH